MAKVLIPTPLRQYAEKHDSVELTGTTVGEVMTNEVRYCYDDETIEAVCANMADIQVRRLPVLNRQKRLVGIVSLADIVSSTPSEEAGQALEGITRPSGLHNQSTDARA